MALTDKLTAIADAIRGKTGKTDGLTLDAMPGEIAGIQSGGDTSMEDGLVERTITSYINDRITTVGNMAFYNNSTITNVSLPNAATVKNACFQNSALQTFFLPKVTKIEDRAFQNCKVEQIVESDFPSNPSIGMYAFTNMSKLKYVKQPHRCIYHNREWETCPVLEKVDLFATCLTYNVFKSCGALATLILRRDDAICELGNMNALSSTPIVNGTGFVYIPRALIEEYRQATNWSSLLPEQFRAIEDYPEICEVGV